MDIREHAQQIYSMYLQNCFASKTPVPNGQQLENVALSAVIWAEAFAAAWKKKGSPPA